MASSEIRPHYVQDGRFHIYASKSKKRIRHFCVSIKKVRTKITKDYALSLGDVGAKIKGRPIEIEWD